MIGRVYKIIHKSEDSKTKNICYVGSSLNHLNIRWKHHRNRFYEYKKYATRFISIHKYFKEHGLNNFQIILIKEYEVIDRNHLVAYEQLWINKLQCVNIQSAFNPIRLNYKSRKAYFYKYNRKRYLCDLCNKELSWKSKQKHEQTKTHIKKMSLPKEFPC